MNTLYFVLLAFVHTGTSLTVHKANTSRTDVIPDGFGGMSHRYLPALHMILPPYHWVVGFREEGDLSKAPIDELHWFSTDGKKVTIPNWRNRLGNNLYQLMYALLFAETNNLKVVELPPKSDMRQGSIHELFDLPEKFTVSMACAKCRGCIGKQGTCHKLTDAIAATKEKCNNPGSQWCGDGEALWHNETNIAQQAVLDDLKEHIKCSDPMENHLNRDYRYQKCTGARKSDYRRVLLKYIKPHMKPSFSYQVEHANAGDLVVHLRGELDLEITHPQGRSEPCVFYESLINAHNAKHKVSDEQRIKDVTVVTQDPKAVCAQQLSERFAGSDVHVRIQSGTMAEDAAALLAARHHVTYGLTTFAEALTLLNEHVKKVSVGSVQYVGNGQDSDYGDDKDLSGKLECGAIDAEAMYDVYDNLDMKEIRVGGAKVQYLLNTKSDAIHQSGSCNL